MLVFLPDWESGRRETAKELARDFVRVWLYQRNHVSTQRVPILYRASQPAPPYVLFESSRPVASRLFINGVDILGEESRLGRRLRLLPSHFFVTGENVVSVGADFLGSRIRLGTVLAAGSENSMREALASLLVEGGALDEPSMLKGSLSVINRSGKRLAETECEMSAAPKTSIERIAGDPVEAALGFLERSQVRGGRFAGSFFGAWDADWKSYRLPSWVWTSGIVLEALVSEGRTLPVSAFMDYLERSRLESIGQGTSYIIRWDLMRDAPDGVTPWVAPNDLAHLAAHGFLSPSLRDHRPEGYELGVAVGDWIVTNCIGADGQLAQGYRLDLQKWERSWLYVDAAYVTELLIALYLETGDDKYLESSRCFLSWFLPRFVSTEGSVAKGWAAKGPLPSTKYLRGYAWVIAGMLAHAAVEPEMDGIAEALKLVLRRVLESQLDNGSWLYSDGEPATGECAKTTAAMAYYLLESHKARTVIGENLYQQCLGSARRALDWSTMRMDLEPNSPGCGGIATWTSEGAIVGRRGGRIAMVYTTAFYVLASSALSRLQDKEA